MNNNRKLYLNKKGNITLLYLAVIMSLFFPLMAVIYDIGMYRVAKQDAKNLQEIAGLACVGASEGSQNGNGKANGAFNVGKCQMAVKQVLYQHLGNASNLKQPFTPTFKKLINSERHIGEYRNGRNLIEWKGTEPRVEPSEINGNRVMVVQLQGIVYHPMFLKNAFLNNSIVKGVNHNVNYNANSEWYVPVTPTTFSAIYDQH